jgi:hypothetical protein
LVIAYFYFDPTPRIWLNSAGISLIIGFALLLSVSEGLPHCNWQTVRLFMMPFCVSSFSSLIKDRNFLLILPPNEFELLVAIGFCLLFLGIVKFIKIFINDH